jgi:hypothetical protein
MSLCLLSQKVDVFSFGVVLLEIVSGREQIDFEVPGEEISLLDWVSSHYQLMCVLKHTESSGWLSIWMSSMPQVRLVNNDISAGSPWASWVTNRGEVPWYYQARRLHSEGRIDELIDRTLDLRPDEEIEVVRIIRIALLCSHNSPEIRPDISLVVEMLQGILDADDSRLFLERLKNIEEMRFGCFVSASRLLGTCASEDQV